MSKLKHAQSKTGKVGITEIVIERKRDDKAKEHGLRVDRGADTPKEGRKKAKGFNFTPKRRKGPNSDSGK